MKVSFEPEVDVIYICLIDAHVEATTHRPSEEVAVIMGSVGQVIGIEVLDASSIIFGSDPSGTIRLENLTTLPT